MKEIVYHVAISLDGFIAQSDGAAEGFLAEGPHVSDYLESLKAYDTAIMGRKTYEFGYGFGLKPGENPYPHMQTYVFSQRLLLTDGAENQIHCVREDYVATVKELRAGAGKPIYLCGGGTFAGLLMDHGLVDRLVLKLNPVSFGQGIPLWRCKNPSIQRFGLEKRKEYENGLLLLEYTRH